jgi:hypothetical protein
MSMASRTVLLLTNTVYGDSTYEMDLWNGTWREAERTSTPLLTIVGGQFLANPGGVSQVPFLFRLAKRFQTSPVVINGGTLQHGLAEGVNTFAREFPASNKVLTAISVTGIPSVVVDNFAGMRGIVEHVVGVLGRKRPLYISGPYSNGEAQERLRAFRETLQAHNIPIRQDEISEGTWMGPSAVESLRQAIARQVPFDAVVCANDLMALAVVEELAAQGIAVPDKVAVTGFDDVEAARFCNPPLSTVFQPIPELGARAFAMAAQGQRDSLARVPARVVFRATAPESLGGEGEHAGQKELEDLRGLYQGLKRNETLTNAMVRVNRILNQVGGLESLERAVALGFAECGITDCSIVLLDGPPDAWTGARRIVHVVGGKPQGGDRAASFPLTSPLPEGEPAVGKDWLLLPLSFEDQDLGYVVFTRAEVSPFVYEALSNVLAGVLHSLLLLDRVRRAETLAAERADRIDELVRPMIASIQQTGAVAREQRQVMEALAKTNTESAERLSGMDSRVTQIRNDLDRVVKLIGSIQEVAETISVIAINASIAAARAGANGRVFGVISAEIRRLSIQTKENTEQIAGVLDVLGGNALGFFEASTETRSVFSRLEGEIQKLLASLGDIQDSMASMDGQAQQVLQTME